MDEFDLACIRGEVSSGNWCLSCQRYNCGHYLDDIGGVISKAAHMRLNALTSKDIEDLEFIGKKRKNV